jgi:hypothetical protein
MYYLIKNNLGGKKCINKNSNDIYSNNMSIGCGQSLTFPSNIKFVRNNSIRCTGASNSEGAQVFCDFVTAKKMNIV